MLHPSGYSVYYDANALTAAQPGERQEMLTAVVDGMLRQDISAGNTTYWLGRDLAGIPEDEPHSPVSYNTETSYGQLAPSASLKLVRDMARLHGFISAIKRWPEQESVIDVGCGPFPVLALATALHHPKAEIKAIEINPDAADAANTMIDIFGLSDRIQVANADIVDYSIDPNTTAAITETFNSALQREPGPKIVRLLHSSGVPLITPSKAELCLSTPSAKFFQHVDLTRDTHASISFNNWSHKDEDSRGVNISTAYYDELGLVLPYDTDTISRGLDWRGSPALRKAMSNAGASGILSYELGACFFEPRVYDSGLEPGTMQPS